MAVAGARLSPARSSGYPGGNTSLSVIARGVRYGFSRPARRIEQLTVPATEELA